MSYSDSKRRAKNKYYHTHREKIKKQQKEYKRNSKAIAHIKEVREHREDVYDENFEEANSLFKKVKELFR